MNVFIPANPNDYIGPTSQEATAYREIEGWVDPRPCLACQTYMDRVQTRPPHATTQYMIGQVQHTHGYWHLLGG